MTNVEYLNKSIDSLKTEVKRLYNMAKDDPSMADSIKRTIFESYYVTYLDSIALSLAYIADYMDEKGEKLNEETDRN